MPPKFSLQTVLDVRHSRVEALEIELGKLFARLRELEAGQRQHIAREGRPVCPVGTGDARRNGSICPAVLAG